MIHLTAQNIDDIQAKAKETAQLFVDEFGEVLDPDTTDWDSVAWIDDQHELMRADKLVGEQYEAAWPVYQSALVAETQRLIDEAN